MKLIAIGLLVAVSFAGAFTNPPGTQWWAAQQTGTSSVGFGAIHFTGKDTGWAVGGAGYILKTVNGGEYLDSAEQPAPGFGNRKSLGRAGS